MAAVVELAIGAALGTLHDVACAAEEILARHLLICLTFALLFQPLLVLLARDAHVRRTGVALRTNGLITLKAAE